ncbi:hypothetical protein RN001_013263 [Aquatica leii]|uniref:HTH psq-type domain-containing protein n=1 Tax=Aquatica leii TaxID=1421715 RepID=A0AAN7QD00_9COLE|nr:hypothetical protein RN001_013263 [Aquatica leii]
MPRTRKTPAARKYAGYSIDALERALDKIKKKKISLREASKQYAISLGTLSRKSRGLQMNKYGRPTVLSSADENRIVDGLQIAAKWGFPFTIRDLQNLVQSYILEIGRTEPRFKDNKPGKDWGCVPKSQFPSLLRETLDTIKENLPAIIQSGLRATGIYPINKNQVLKRIPGVIEEERQNETALTSVLQTHLQTMRYGKVKAPERKKKRLNVVPDSSAGEEDFSDLRDDNDLGDNVQEDENGIQAPQNDEIEEGSFVLVAFPLEGKINKFRNYVGEHNRYQIKIQRYFPSHENTIRKHLMVN